MTTPEKALQAAREAARAGRLASSRRGADAPDYGAHAWELDDPASSTKRLVEWAIIDPDRAPVYSTRRFGQPLTLLKRLLVRFLSQYLNEVSAQQSRFNAAVAAHVMRLEERVAELERRPPE